MDSTMQSETRRELKLYTGVQSPLKITATCESLNETIRSLHGRETLGELQQMEKKRINISKETARLTFLKRCRDSKVIPKN